MFSTFGADPVIFVEGSKAAVAVEFVFCLSHAPIIPDQGDDCKHVVHVFLIIAKWLWLLGLAG